MKCLRALILGFLGFALAQTAAPQSLTLYGVNPTDDGLSIIDPATGNVTFVARLDPDTAKFTTPVAMAVRPLDLEVFVWNNSDLDPSTGGTIYTGVLLRVDTCTGLATQVGDETGLSCHSMAFSPDGKLYANCWASPGPAAVYEISTTTGAATPAAIPNPQKRLEGLDFGPDGTLYGLTLALSSAQELVTVDLNTGTLTVIGPVVQGDGTNYGTAGSIVFSPSGELLASMSSKLLSVNPADATVSGVQQLWEPDGYPHFTQGMGFAPHCGEETPPGDNVIVRPPEKNKKKKKVTIKYKQVHSPGLTEVEMMESTPAPPAGLKHGAPPVSYHISTSAPYSGPIQVCIDHGESQFLKNEQVKIAHYKDMTWKEITTVKDTANSIVCGETDSFSVFAVLEPDNQPPTADAGPDQSILCAAVDGTAVTLDGSGSSDPDGDALTFTWTGPFSDGMGTATGATPTVTLPLGTHTITLRVDDGLDGTSEDTVEIRVGVGVAGVPPPLSEMVSDGWFVPLHNRAFRAGSTLPLKLQLYCDGTVLTAADVAPPQIYGLARNSEPVDLTIVDLDAGQANDEGVLFRFADGIWVFNLSTKGWETGTYVLAIEMPDHRIFQAGFVIR